MPKQPVVPLDVAEFLRVTLQIAKQASSLDTDQKRRIGMVLAMYEIRRDEALMNQGFKPTQIRAFAKSAGLALAEWFEDQSHKDDAAAVVEAAEVSEREAIPGVDYDMSEFEEAFNVDDQNTD